jgi:hypothetical protein
MFRRPGQGRLPVEDRLIRQIVLLIAAATLLRGQPAFASEPDEIDLLLRRGQIPAGMMQRHGYSDFTDPLGRFLDLLAAGAVAEARAIQPDACATWLATRQGSALTGKVWVWNTEIDLDRLCAHP